MKKSLLLFTAILTVFLFALPVYATDIRLSSSCTLADAIIAANHDRPGGGCPAGRGADTIILSQDITLRAELPAITSKITIEGNGYTISGNNRYRIFYNKGRVLIINNLTMTKGYVEGELIRAADRRLRNAIDNPIGGAIVNWEGTLTISGSSFSDNLAEYYGGAIYNKGGELSISSSVFSDNSADDESGAIYNRDGTLSISDSTFSDNSAEYGGAIVNRGYGELDIVNSTFSYNSSSGAAGVIYSQGELSISGSNFSHNSADAGAGAISNNGELSISGSNFSHNSAGWGGAIYNSGDLRITNSRFSLNSADWRAGGAIFNEYDGELGIGNSTFSGNSADKGGAIFNEEDGDLRIGNSTFSGNSADRGGAIFNGEDGKLRMTNSIITGNGGTCISDSRLRHNINNFIQDGSCSPDLRGDPKLGELVEPEDGSPAYFPLLAGSRAIDAADDGYCPETDQIGTVRPQGAGCDIGAIEYVAP